MADLLLTLGHNASAVAVQLDNERATIANAYELERLTGVKSDSHFPVEAMAALKERGVESFDRVYVTHWDPMNSVDGLKSKYWDRSVFPESTPIITQEGLGLTHHDCHMRAAMLFAGDDFPTRDVGVLVLDGFGSFGEHASYYRVLNGTPHLVKRFFGYHTSLGLMYQYATAFLGMKMHEDEYKLLGYGARVGETGIDLKVLGEIATAEATRLLKEMRRADARKLGIELENLPNVQDMWAGRLQNVLDQAGMIGVESNSGDARRVIGYVVQKTLEIAVYTMIKQDFGLPRNLIFTGGCAFNVELNRMLLDMIPGKLCVMPLAGDQGNSLGLWAFHNRRISLDLGDLCWGKRSFVTNSEEMPKGMVVVDKDSDDVYEALRATLQTTGFVNIVRGNMEFGPRALCNTTTLALPNRPDVVDEINRINGRDTVMPFAPVVWGQLAKDWFPEIDRLHRSERFMICALAYRAGVGQDVPGAALLTAKGLWTGRPQVYEAKYEGDSVERLLRAFGGILINTSFNVHGVPICLDLKDVVHSHQYQRERNENVRTVVIVNQE